MEMLEHPDDPKVSRAWTETQRWLREIVAACRNAGYPLILVAFPYVQQFAEPERLGYPQKVLEDFAAEEGIEFLDLLPPLEARARQQGIAPQALYVDDNHPSVERSVWIAELMAKSVSESLARNAASSE